MHLNNRSKRWTLVPLSVFTIGSLIFQPFASAQESNGFIQETHVFSSEYIESTTEIVSTESITTQEGTRNIGLETMSDIDVNESSFSNETLNQADVSTSDNELAFTIEDYKRASASDLARLLREGHVSPDTLIDYAEAVIRETNPDLNGVIKMRLDLAKEELKAMEDTGQPFYGVPILVKGLGHSVSGGENTNGLEFLAGETSQRTGRYVKALQDLGFVVIGQTSYPQFGWINVTNSDLYGITHNPWDLDHNPGGSSGGSAAAVTIGQVPIATTSDAGGSTRIPASFSSLIGLHPTSDILQGNSKGQTSHFSVTRTMEDTHRLFDALLKEKYANQINQQELDVSIPIAYSLKTPAGTPIDMEAIQAVKNAVSFLQSKGFKTIEVDYPIDGKFMMENYYVNAAAGSSTVNFLAQQKLGRPVQKDDLELLTWALYQTSKDLTTVDIQKAKENIQHLKDQMDDFYQQYPIFLTPTTAYPAPAADYNHIPETLKSQMADMSNLSKEDKLSLIYQQWLPAWTKTPFTQMANLTETPSLSLPTHLTEEGLPIGILFGAARYNDKLLLQLGDLFEQANKFQLFYRTEIEIEEDILPFDVEYIPVDYLLRGKTTTVQKGENGKKLNQYEISYKGTSSTRRFINSETILLPITEIIYVGTGQDNTPYPTELDDDLSFIEKGEKETTKDVQYPHADLQKKTEAKASNSNQPNYHVSENNTPVTVTSANRNSNTLPNTGDKSNWINYLVIIFMTSGFILLKKMES